MMLETKQHIHTLLNSPTSTTPALKRATRNVEEEEVALYVTRLLRMSLENTCQGVRSRRKTLA
jgi:hypothetical protein